MTKKSKSKSPAAKKPDPNVASNLPDLEATQENVKAWKKKRTRSRSQLTLLCKEIENIISQKGSRTSVITLLEQANKILQVSEDLNDKLTTDLQDDTEVNEQFAKQLEYTKKIADIKEMVEDYLEERKNDAASVAASKVHSAASVRSSQALSSHYEDEEEDDSALSEDVQKWREESKRAFQPEAAPDDWIDDYRSGRLKVKSTTDVGRKTTVKTTLSIYSGSALEWFSWIDLYKSLVHDSNSSSGEKLAILKSHLKGDCQDIVYGLGGGESAYKEALRRLKQDCGRRDVMRAAHLQALEKLDPGKGILTKRYAERVRTHLFDIERIGGANPADIIEKTCSKLSVHDRLAWNAGKGKGGEECRSLEEFGDWLCSRAAAYRSSYDIATNQQPPPKDGGRKPAHTNKASSTTEDGQTSRVPKCYKCQEEHRLDFCEAFKSLTIEEKLAFLTQHRLCFRCLRPFHTSRVCRSTKTCGVGDCRRRHHALLHEERPAAVNAHDHSCSSSTPNQKIVAMGVLKTNARSAEGNIVGANIFFDEGSDTTLVRQGFARRIGAKGIQQTLNLYGVAGSRSQVPSERITIHLETPAGEEVKIDAMSVRKVCDQTPMIWWSQLKTRWPHLNDLPLKDSGGAVDILLGLDHAHLLIPLELRKGEDEEPYAIRTRLGWIVRGTIIATLNKKTARMNFLTSQPEEGLPEKPFDVAFREFCDAEAYGTEFQQDKLHPEDQLAVDIVTNGTRQLEAGYEVALPWRNPRPDLPANRKLAEYRLNCLFRKFEREADYKADYQVAMKKYVDSGYVSRVPEEKLEDANQYFIPHHGVYKKGSSKLRIVFDSAAVFRGKCLNDELLSGPKWQNQLPSVLIRFREKTIAFAADIEAMFSRVRLRPEDAAYHRFLWKEDEAADPVVYQMDRLTFGDRCSPFVAIATTRKTAADHSDDPLIRKAILENLYMDDYLDSTRTIEEAIERAKGVRDTLAKGDFHLQAWTSNSPAFVAALSPTESSDGAATQPMLAVNDGATKVLGVGWKPTTDQLSFVIDSMEEMRFSRLHLASFVAGIFDPLGLAAPWIVKAKIKLRELDVRGVMGKDPLPPDILSWWIDWAASLAQLKSLEIPRCLFPEEEKIIQSELHTFTDASEEAFAAAVYVRNVRADGNVDVRLLIAKTKIAAKKVISIPKSELQAALMGARLANYVKSALTVPIIKRRFWTDSSCVRNWVRSTSAYYKPFVSHRIGEIQTLTDAAEWRFVPGRLNSSDLATRSVVEPIPAEWFDGPAFLQKNEEDWPTDLPWLAVKEEIRTAKNFRLTSTCHVPDDKIDWTSLQIKESDLRALAQKKTSHLKIIRQCQEEAFSEHTNRLKKKKELKPSSKLISLTPFLDRDGLLRLGGRLRRAPLPLENRHPILLPAAHPLTEKIIKAFHRGFLHAGTDFVLSQIQNHFWIIQGKEAVKKIRRKCPECIKDRVRPATQLMGELPYFRLEACTPPFYRTAVDYFGPFEVGFARNRTTKRYGALFTCLVTRAVYVDLAKSLSSDDFLLVFRRFISLYGAPRCVYSDNGTNFVGAEKEITADIKQLQESDGLKKIATEKSIDWRFQPPSSPHFGGAHESLVKSVKKALYRALAIEEVAHRYPTEETMRTLLFEVGGILNARPVTTFSSDPADFRPLTPNDFMNRSSTDHVPPGSFQDALPREQYRYLQRALGLFWDLWKGVYLQSLAARKKWRNPSRNFAVGDAVLISDPRQPRASWTVGRVTQVYPGEDQLVRVVKVKTEDGEYQKPIHRLCLLAPVEDSGRPASRPDSGEDGTAPPTI